MKKLVAAASFAATFGIYAAAANAASIDMNDPRRALGREGDVRIDAQLVSETVAHGAPIMVTWQRRSSLGRRRVTGVTAFGRSSLFSFPF